MDSKILIVGGGIGGLTLGAVLRQRGFTPDIVEVTPKWAPVGAGITLGINAMRIYRELGLESQLMDVGRELTVARITDHDDHALSQMNFGALSDRLGPSIAIHRAELHSVLANANPGVHLGTTVTEIAQADTGVTVTFSDGTNEKYDLVIGADGIHSSTRRQLFGEIEYRYSGYTCWRFVVEMDNPPRTTTEMWGAGRRMGIVPLSGNRVYCFSTLNCPADDPRWNDLSLDDYRSLFADFGGDVPRILDTLTSANELIQGDLAEVHVPNWTEGRIGLLGDAAHAMTPNMGQGAAMAIEDAWVMGEEIAKHGATNAALQAYETRRRPRVKTVQNRSWNIGKLAQASNPILGFMRNQLMRFAPDRAAAKSLEALLTADL